MPNILWKELDDIIHKKKADLQIAYTIEKQSKSAHRYANKLRERLSKELEYLHGIVAKQPDIEKEKENENKHTDINDDITKRMLS